MKHTALVSLYSFALADLTQVNELLRLLVLLTPLIVGVVQALRRPPRREPKPRRKSTAPRVLVPAVAIVVALMLLNGCAFERPSRIVRALSSDTNAVSVSVRSPWGTVDVRRNVPGQ